MGLVVFLPLICWFLWATIFHFCPAAKRSQVLCLWGTALGGVATRAGPRNKANVLRWRLVWMVQVSTETAVFLKWFGMLGTSSWGHQAYSLCLYLGAVPRWWELWLLVRGGVCGGGGKRQPLGIDNLDSPDMSCIIPHLACECKKKWLQESFII